MNQLKTLRMREGLSQLELAKKLKVAPPLVSQWESERVLVPKKRLAELCQILKCNEHDLLDIVNVDNERLPSSTRQNISFYLTKRGKNQSWLAKQLGVSRASVSLFLLGKNKRGLFDLNKIANILGVSIEQLESKLPELKEPDRKNPAYTYLQDKILGGLNIQDIQKEKMIKPYIYFWIKSFCEGDNIEDKDILSLLEQAKKEVKKTLSK